MKNKIKMQKNKNPEQRNNNKSKNICILLFLIRKSNQPRNKLDVIIPKREEKRRKKISFFSDILFQKKYAPDINSSNRKKRTKEL